MRIGIIGSGNIGGTLARLWALAGHEIVVANSRGPESLAGLVEIIGSKAQAGTVDEAAAFGDVVLVAMPFSKYNTVPAGPLAGRIVIDAMNYYAQRDGHLNLGGGNSSQLLARHLSESRVVKAFNTMYYQTLASQGHADAPAEERLVIFLAGDEPQAKAVVASLIEEIGFAAVDTGTLAEGGTMQQPGSPIYNRPLSLAQAREVLAAM